MCRNNDYSKWCQTKSSGFLTLGKSTRECSTRVKLKGRPIVNALNEAVARNFCEEYTYGQRVQRDPRHNAAENVMWPE